MASWGLGMLPSLRLGSGKQLRALFFCWLTVHNHVLGSPLIQGAGRAGFDEGSGGGSSDTAVGAKSDFKAPSQGVAYAVDLQLEKLSADLQTPPKLDSAMFKELTARKLAAAKQYWAEKDAVEAALKANTSNASEGRKLQMQTAPYPFFSTAPYVNIIVFDSHDTNCDRNFESPPVTDPTTVGYPADGTDALRQKNMACGIAPARFVFRTSNLPAYTDTTVDAKMQVRITCQKASFVESLTCENVLDATGDFPRIEGCRFMSNEARLILSTRMKVDTTYSLTVKVVMPPGRMTASNNSYIFTTEYDPTTVIEGTKSPVDLGYTVPHAKDESEYGNDYSQRGYITGFSWNPDLFYSSAPGITTIFTFGLRTFGTMDTRYAIDIVAYPTNVWKFGQPGNDCEQFSPPHIGTTCRLMSFQGALATESNGFRLSVGTTPMINLGSQTTPEFALQVTNPEISVNMYWTATSFRIDEDQLRQEPYTVFIDRPINVLGTPTGSIAEFDRGDVGVEQWVTLEFKPGNTVMPSTEDAGMLVILPPETFTIVASAAPQIPSAQYNQLPCLSWPEADRIEGRWLCPLGDTAPFKETTYRVRLKVLNPPTSGAARSWRVELWEQEATKPVAVTRGIRGMEVSGPMSAALSQANQLLGSINTIRFDITPSQPIGNVVGTRLRVVAPPGFIIIKRCLGFERIELPECECQGSDSNSFELVFERAGAILGGVSYAFSLQLQNPVENIADDVNVWSFDTLRPDGVARDTARFQGFFLYPYEFTNFVVVPQSRKVGPQTIVIRFTSPLLIPFDDYIRIRAPEGVSWYTEDLQFTTSAALTEANKLGAQSPSVEFETPNELVCQLTTTAEANFEYGISARAVIPQNTPVPNAWWIEQYRRTGLPAPNSWRFLSSKGTTGFKTQVLVNAKVEPFNIVAEGWQNPTLFVFETTLEVMPQVEATASGSKLVPAILKVTAPLGFTFICPISVTTYMPDYTIDVPSDMICNVDHNDLEERNKLYLEFPTGLQGNTRYAFTIDVVNGKFTDPTANTFTMETMLDGDVMEDVVVNGFELADRMDNTRYIALPSREDRRVEATSNVVTFVIGTTVAISTNTVLEVRAPIGFKFREDCTGLIGQADWVSDMKPMPKMGICQSLSTIDLAKINIAHVVIESPWELGSYGLFVTVENPMFTPARNFWGFSILDSDYTPRMSESWVYGFQIQVVKNPMLRSYNSGNGVDGEAAINYVDISFSLTTRMEPHETDSHAIVVTSPPGFVFPNICRGFEVETYTPGFTGFPEGTGCQGNGANVLKVSVPPMRPLENGTAYMFRFLVVNPRQTFTNVNDPEKYWRIETQFANGEMVDLNRVIPSFPVLDRLKYFKVDTLSQVGLNSTTFRFLFRTDQPLPPQQTVHFYPPDGATFGGLENGACIDTDPVLISAQFETPLIAGVTRLPEWVSCIVKSSTELMLRNEEPILGGRPLISGPVFEFFIMNASNPESTPQLNLFRVVAKTSTPLGQEVWTTPGWVVYPELTMTSVVVSNKGYGLYTNFSITLQTITEVPQFGSIRIIAPDDYYFGPVIETAATRYDPLVSEPSPQGAGQVRPPADETTTCHILRPDPGWACAFEFEPCVIMDELDEMLAIGINLLASQESTRVANREKCFEMREKCDPGGPLSELASCSSQGSTLVLDLAKDVTLPSRRILRFIIQGYNARQVPLSDELNQWKFMTRNSDSEKTILDEKLSVPGVSLIGIVAVDSIVPSNTKVSSIENYVTITLRLATQCDPRAILRITHPMDYMRGANAAFSGPAISTGYTFPQQVEKRQSLNVIELESIEEALPADIPLVLILGLSNPPITPRRADNVWTFQAFSASSGSQVLLNVNLNVTGFKIFGEFSGAYVTGTVLSPDAQNVVGARFSLKSVLSASRSSRMKIWMPPGFVPLKDCGGPLFSPEYNPNREGVKNPFPNTISYFPLPSGTECYSLYDEDSAQHYILLFIDLMIDYGLDFAFEFAVTNPTITPPSAVNVWRFESLQNNVILHLRRSIPGFELEQIKEVSVTPSDTTTLLPLHRLEFYMMSDKYIQGGSKVEIVGPNGYIFTCAFFSTDRGLANTTTCYVKEPNIAEFTMDTADPKQPNSPFRLFVYVSNPEFTPQANYWNFRIISPLGKTIDMRDYVPSFDITGRIQVDVRSTFPYLGQVNPLRIVFVQSTILNQADIGNELVLTAPEGYVFPVNCTEGFRLRMSNEVEVEDDGTGYDSGFVFPPEGMSCTGYANATVTIRFPDGAGLLRNNYTLDVDVINPGYQPNGTTWQFITRVTNPELGERIVDANRTLEGFALVELLPMRTDEGSAERLVRLSMLVVFVFCLAAFF